MTPQLGVPWQHGHEQVVFCHDPGSGLHAIIALYSTALGPGLGGTRFRPYSSPAAALADVLDLSRAMAYKNALAGLDHGGGKAVIIGDPRRDRSEPLLRAYGRFVASLGGRYVTACDVGTTVADMDLIARECRFVTGRSEANGGAGDSGVLTAVGVFAGMRAAAQVRWGQPALAGRLIGVSGVGKVGRALVPLLLADGARVVVHDPDDGAVARVLKATADGAPPLPAELSTPGSRPAAATPAAADPAAATPAAANPAAADPARLSAVGSAEELMAQPLDVWAPCALGGAITEDLAARLRAEVVCGAANNQLATARAGEVLAERDVLYCPDYCVNAGGVIAVADELAGYCAPRARQRAEGIFDTTLRVLQYAHSYGLRPEQAADTLAEERMSQVSALRRIAVLG